VSSAEPLRRLARRVRPGRAAAAASTATGRSRLPAAGAPAARPLPQSPREVRRLHHLAKVDPDARIVALTFDDGPFERRTLQLLQLLAAHEVPATFFMTGRRAEAHPSLVQRVAAAGHGIASHGYLHRDLVGEATPRIRREIQAGKAVLEQITGREVSLFRPPHSSRDERVRIATHEVGQWLVHWSVSVNDRKRTAAEIVDSVRQRLAPNAIVLLHELPQTIRALPTIIAEARAAGYEFVGLPVGRPLDRNDVVGAHAVRRLWSATRQHTAGQVLATREQAHQAVLVGEDLGPAEAVAIAFAAAEGALVIPARSRSVPAPMQAHLERLRPEGALVIGDQDVLGPSAVEQLNRWIPCSERLDHDDVVELARVLGARLPASPLLFVTGSADPCTLVTVASVAGRLEAPLLPLAGDALRPVEKRWLTEQRPEHIVLVGEADASLCSELHVRGATVTHVRGTAPVIAGALARTYPTRRVWLAAPSKGSDLVVAAAAAAQEDAALLFADPVAAGNTAAAIRDLAPDAVTVVGGPAAISAELLTAILAPEATRAAGAADPTVTG
jgi:peptidoglycan/xylan/chitin deacetylase (PgdA/CDA1 family)